MSRSLPILTRKSAILLVIDMQEKLLPAIHESERLVASASTLIQAGQLLGVPVLATEQYPAGLGRTCASFRESWGDVRPIEKLRFSACVEEVMEVLTGLDRPHVLVTGIETHVCVQQSVLDLLRRGFFPFVCADAVSSRHPLDRDVALQRMRDAGAIVTTVESVLFEVLAEAGTQEFKAILKLIK